MKNASHIIYFILPFLFSSINVQAAYRSANDFIDPLLQEQFMSETNQAEYQKNILWSRSLYPKDLLALLRREFSSVDNETQRRQKIVRYFAKESSAYKFANYRILNQIREQSERSDRIYTAVRKKYNDFLKKAPPQQKIYLISATNSYFFKKQIAQKLSEQNRQISWWLHGHPNRIHYLSLFDNEYHHILTYPQMHVDMNRQRRIIAAQPSKEKHISQQTYQIYQNLFDQYLHDLNRIGKGLDIINPDLLTELADMKNEIRTLK